MLTVRTIIKHLKVYDIFHTLQVNLNIQIMKVNTNPYSWLLLSLCVHLQLCHLAFVEFEVETVGAVRYTPQPPENNVNY